MGLEVSHADVLHERSKLQTSQSGRRLIRTRIDVGIHNEKHTRSPLSPSYERLQLVMADSFDSLEDSLCSPLEYDAEVAYIAATSPKPREELKSSTSNSSLWEFDFSTGNEQDFQSAGSEVKKQEVATTEKAALASEREELEKKRSPKKKEESSLTLMRDPNLPLQPRNKEKLSLSPPVQVTAADYTLDTESTLPGTPKSRLRQIKAAGESPLAPMKQKFKFGSELKYKTLIIYGTTGCSRTHLAQKLVHSNPVVFAKVVSSTTRKRRPSELDGVDFHFVSHEEMSAGIARGDFLEHIQVHIYTALSLL